MPVEDVFTITGRGTVATGRVERGVLHVSEEVEIVGVKEETRKVVVTGIEMFRKEQKELVAGEVADPDYFGRDTGDASKDDPRNQDEIGENELLVVSFGTSFNDSRVADIKGIEDALQAANPDWSVRRAFTAQIIINHIQARDGEKIDNMQQAMERAVANGVKKSGYTADTLNARRRI